MKQFAFLARRGLGWCAMALGLAALVGCGGGGDAEPSVTPPQAPTITSQPASQAVPDGAAATLTVAAGGDVPLSYVWRRNGSTIAGATNSRYTTPALALADSGASYTVVVSNAAGSVTSTAATITVTPVAPSISQPPQAASALAGQTAQFSVVAAGSAPLAYQWLRDGVDIAGANGATYTTPALAVADNGALFSVRVSNAAGFVVSNGVALTVLAPLAWAPAQLLESGDTPVEVREEGIDDEGRVTVAFIKTEAARATLYATRGTPGPAGTAPVWSAPVIVDNVPGLSGTALNTEGLRVAVAPSGNAAVLFTRRAPCTATTYRTSGTCTYRYVARYLADGTGWEAPVLAGDAPGATTASDVTLLINDAGDIAFIGTGWVRAGTGTFSERQGTWRRARGAAGFTAQHMVEATLRLPTARLGLDRDGHMLLVAEAAQNATVDIAAYRGDVVSGFGAQAVLDQLSNDAGLVAMAVGRNGHQAVVWTQNSGVQSRYFAATSEANGAWQVVDIAALATTLDKRALAMSDTGTATFHDIYRSKVWRRAAGAAWSPEISLPAEAATPGNDWDCALARDGDLLCTMTGGFNQRARWSSYDATNNIVVKREASAAPADYVLGVDTINRGVGYSFPLLAPNGIGFMSLRNGYDVLPSPALPAGQSRSVSNLWGVFLK